MKSWRTTAAGFALGLSILAGEAAALLDDDPTTEFSIAKVITALGALGLGWFSRDNKVSSEDAGAK